MSWKIVAHAEKRAVQAALLRHEDLEDWDAEIVLSGHERAEDTPQEWILEAYLPRKPRRGDLALIANLFDDAAPEITSEAIADQDWVTLSQQATPPIHAGRFVVRTPDYPASEQPGAVEFIIPASQAFGTGQHETTAGCLTMLDQMKRNGIVARNLIDIGTGTGLLGFAAMSLWSRALSTASDIDPICEGVVRDNAALNGVTLGSGASAMLMVTAPGLDHSALQVRAPYDLVIANILAGPLVELAPDIADATAPSGNVLLAGLLQTQEMTVRRAYRRAGFRLAARLVKGDWSILWLRKRNLP
ncbi:50S ribosomal protein L11 methyltransferase [Altererythrobacter sp. SALINAS58]|uniref:50S ribosomal protein L11 methyltransferase n=1 Tax=Alteripontixanthobacter muriae TaxID=2705546 RepID=UPI001575907F|nr:50S ribosomal protein L11 methyltransferase [Alteripontixanthobacter muriae]NTZ43057.1 50S ribosomal protein L11 methyltransferase [Alteripontixanthobacter muriae]